MYKRTNKKKYTILRWVFSEHFSTYIPLTFIIASTSLRSSAKVGRSSDLSVQHFFMTSYNRSALAIYVETTGRKGGLRFFILTCLIITIVKKVNSIVITVLQYFSNSLNSFNELLSMSNLPSLRNTYNGANGIDNDKRFSVRAFEL